MTVDQAIAKIPVGWRLRLTNWETPEESGWGAVLYQRDGRRAVGDEPMPAAAILAAIKETGEDE